MPKQRPIDVRLEEAETRVRLLKQRKRVEMERTRLSELTPKRRKRAKRA